MIGYGTAGDVLWTVGGLIVFFAAVWFVLRRTTVTEPRRRIAQARTIEITTATGRVGSPTCCAR